MVKLNIKLKYIINEGLLLGKKNKENENENAGCPCFVFIHHARKYIVINLSKGLYGKLVAITYMIISVFI